MNNISEDEIYEFNRNLSFPRRNDGSEGHKKAISFIEGELTKNGIKYEEEKFVWNDLRVKLRLTRSLPMIILSFRLFIGSIMMFFHDPNIISGNFWYIFLVEPKWVMVVAAALLMAWFIANYSDCVVPKMLELNRINNGNYTKREKKRIARGEKIFNEGTNIVVRMGIDGTTKEAAEKNTPVIIFAAHYDSISAKLPTPVLNGLYVFFATVPFSCILSFILLPFTIQTRPEGWLMILGVILLIIASGYSSIGLLIYSNLGFTNESAGAFDNASGCATLYALIRNLKDLQLNADVRLIFVDCEEEGLMGTIEYLHEHEEELKRPDVKPRVSMISLDGTGGRDPIGLFSSYGMPRVIKCERGLKKQFQTIGKELFNMKMPSLWSPYSSSDHAVFGEFGFKAIQVFSMGMISNTKNDTFDKVNKETLGKVAKIITEFVIRSSK